MSRNLMKQQKSGMSGSLVEQMAVLIDEAMNLEVACDWYHDEDPLYCGPPSVDQLMSTAMKLRAAYMKMALITGVDPCEQLPSTKQRLKDIRDKRTHINFDD